jgi:hypothetical protein
MTRVKKTITLSPKVIEWAKTAIENGTYPGVRSFSALIEYLLSLEMDKNGR